MGNEDTLRFTSTGTISATLINSIRIVGGGLVSINGTVSGTMIRAIAGGVGSRSVLASGAVDQTLSSGGTLSGVIYRGILDLSWDWSALTIQNGITFLPPSSTSPAQIKLSGGDNQSSILRISGTTTLDRVTVNIGHTGINGTNALQNYDPSGTGAILTLGHHLIINQTGFNAVLGSSDHAGDGIINYGAINANFAGGVFTIDATNFTNRGAITVSNGDTIRLASSGSIDARLINGIANSGGLVSINGTVTGGRITANAGGVGSVSMGANGAVDQTLASGGTLSGVTYEGTLDLSRSWSALTIAKGIRFLGPNLTGSATINLHGGNNQSSVLDIAGTTRLSNVTINIGHDGTTGTNSLVNYDAAGTGAILTLGSGVAINQVGLTAALSSSDHAGDGITNYGMINANVAGGVFSIDGTNFNNHGHITVSNGDTLRLVGAINPALIGSITNSGGFVSINGTVTGGSIVAPTGGVGSISIGANGVVDQTLASGGTLNGVTYEGTLDLSRPWSALTIANGIRFLGAGGSGPATIDLHGGNIQSSVLDIAGTTRLNSVTINIGHDLATGSNSLVNLDPAGTGAVLTLGPGVTINQVGYTAALGSSDHAGDGIVNLGIINAGQAGGVFSVDATNFVNHGTIAVSNGDTLRLTGAINAALIGSIANTGGFVSINGTVTGGVIRATSGVGSLAIAANGVVDQTSGGTLSGVTYEGTLDLSRSWSTLTIANGIKFGAAAGAGSATINLHGGDNQSSVLNVMGTTTLDNATINIGHDGTTGTNMLFNDDPAGTGAVLTLGRRLIVNQAGAFAVLGSSDHAGDGIVNLGTINADVAGGVFTIDATNFTNMGHIDVSNGDTLRLTGTISTALIKSISNSGGFVSINGTVTGGTITATGGVGSRSILANGTVDQSLNSGGTLSGVTWRGTLDLSRDWSALTIRNGIIFRAAAGAGPATVNLHGGNNQSSVLRVAGTTTLDNVTINIGHDGTNGSDELMNYDPNDQGAYLTLGRRATITQVGMMALIGSSGYRNDRIFNLGTINAGQAGGMLAINGFLFFNKGRIAIANGDELILLSRKSINLAPGIIGGAGTIAGDITNYGTMEASGGTLDIKNSITGTGGTLAIEAAATLLLEGFGTVSGQTIAFNGTGGQLSFGAGPNISNVQISGFAASDAIDLTAFAFSASNTVSFSENGANTQGTLTVTDGHGTTEAVFTLFGQYVAAGFGLASDGHTGTAISYTPPAGQESQLLAAVHH